MLGATCIASLFAVGDIYGRALDTSKPLHESLHTSRISRRKNPNRAYFPLQGVKSHFHFQIVLGFSKVRKKCKP